MRKMKNEAPVRFIVHVTVKLGTGEEEETGLDLFFKSTYQMQQNRYRNVFLNVT